MRKKQRPRRTRGWNASQQHLTPSGVDTLPTAPMTSEMTEEMPQEGTAPQPRAEAPSLATRPNGPSVLDTIVLSGDSSSVTEPTRGLPYNGGPTEGTSGRGEMIVSVDALLTGGGTGSTEMSNRSCGFASSPIVSAAQYPQMSLPSFSVLPGSGGYYAIYHNNGKLTPYEVKPGGENMAQAGDSVVLSPAQPMPMLYVLPKRTNCYAVSTGRPVANGLISSSMYEKAPVVYTCMAASPPTATPLYPANTIMPTTPPTVFTIGSMDHEATSAPLPGHTATNATVVPMATNPLLYAWPSASLPIPTPAMLCKTSAKDNGMIGSGWSGLSEEENTIAEDDQNQHPVVSPDGLTPPAARDVDSGGSTRLLSSQDCSLPGPQRPRVHSHGVIQSSPRQHPCKQCNRRFRRLSHLKRHQYTHTSERPYRCFKCHRNYARKDFLLSHLTNMHNDTPVRCEICERPCTTIAELLHHRKQNHNVRPSSFVEITSDAANLEHCEEASS